MITALARGLLTHIPDDLDEPLDWIAIFNWLWFSTIGRAEHRRNQAELNRREAERRLQRISRGELTDLERITHNLSAAAQGVGYPLEGVGYPLKLV